MDPLWLVLIGMAVVVGGVLLLRLHAFVALLLAAMAVGALTPHRAVLRAQLQKDLSAITQVAGDRLTLRGKPAKGIVPEAAVEAIRFDATATDGYRQVGRLRILGGEGNTLQVASLSGTAIEVQPGDFLIHPLALRAGVEAAGQTLGTRLSRGFGSTCGSIGILIALAAIVGKCLLESGAADRIVRSALALVGEARAAVAFLASGFLLGIPVFFDTVFYLMIPLGKALRMRTGRNYLLYVLSIVAGATMSHSLVPPTPGPLVVADQLGVNIGLMMLAGCVVGIGCVAFAYVYASWANARHEVPLRETADLSMDELHELAHRDAAELPPLWLSLLPIVLPVILIGGQTVLDLAWSSGDLSPAQAQVLAAARVLGDKNMALALAAAIAAGTLVWKRRTSRSELARSMASALAGGGVIILITAAGGAFGQVLQQTGVAERIEGLSAAYQLPLIPFAFLVATLIRTAQGSATVAMITAAGVLGGLATSGPLPFHPVYLALAIGCGSKPISWMNDSGFWVICKMSGMTEAETLRFVTPMTASMGVIGLLITMLGAALFPMVP